MYALLGMLALAAASTDLATLEGTTWAAKTWSGAAARGGDPDPYDDEAGLEILPAAEYAGRTTTGASPSRACRTRPCW